MRWQTAWQVSFFVSCCVVFRSCSWLPDPVARACHQRDPARAISLISEILDRIALLDRRKSQGNDAGGIPLRRRDADPPPPPIGPPDDRTKKDLQENPILRDLYSRSPLASLRMLQRMREAAADQPDQNIRPGEFDPGANSKKAPGANPNTKILAGARRGAARSR